MNKKTETIRVVISRFKTADFGAAMIEIRRCVSVDAGRDFTRGVATMKIEDYFLRIRFAMVHEIQSV